MPIDVGLPGEDGYSLIRRVRALDPDRGGLVPAIAITAFASRSLGARLQTFSVGFDFDRGINELPRARRVARHFGTDHHELHVSGGDLPDVLRALVRAHDEPFADAANIPFYRPVGCDLSYTLLLTGVRDFALEQYGPLAKTVFNSWGITRCTDFGDLVFNLIDYNVFSKTDSDRREDFGEIYDFDEAFVKPFSPQRRPRRSSLGALGN